MANETGPLDPKVMWKDIDRLKKLMDGDSDLGLVGMRDTMEQHEEVIAEIRQMKILVKGIGIGLFINVAFVVAVAVKLFGG